MRYFLSFIIAVSFISISMFANAEEIQSTKMQGKLARLESSFDGKIGIYAINTNNNQVVAYRANERFPVQSTCKLMVVAALLKQSQEDKGLLQQKVKYQKSDLMAWHPVTGNFVNSGMTLEALSEATMIYSDNTAANLIIKKLGGPKAVTEFAQAIGNPSFNIVHYEGSLNSNPKNKEDTATPKDMAISVQKLTLGHVLTSLQRAQLVTWMRNNTTGYKRIRAGVPIGWVVADKTGSGDYGIANDIGILWSPTCQPIVLAIYTLQNKPNTKRRDDIVASATSIILNEFAKNDPGFEKLFL